MKVVDVKKLTVEYNGRVVGYLAEVDGKIAFQYDLEWQENGFSISPFSLPISNKVFVCNKPTFGGLFGVFYDSLPDGWGELLFRRLLARQGLNADRFSPLTRLSLVGESGLGALRYEPDYAEMMVSEHFDLDELSREAEAIWKDRDEGVDLDEIYKLGGSSGGARPKVHLDIRGDHWIVKFPCSFDVPNIGKHEFNANKLASKAGIYTNDFKLFPSRKYKGFFGAKRFDYCDGGRVHMISLSSVLETSHRIPNLDSTPTFCKSLRKFASTRKISTKPLGGCASTCSSETRTTMARILRFCTMNLLVATSSRLRTTSRKRPTRRNMKYLSTGTETRPKRIFSPWLKTAN